MVVEFPWVCFPVLSVYNYIEIQQLADEFSASGWVNANTAHIAIKREGLQINIHISAHTRL